MDLKQKFEDAFTSCRAFWGQLDVATARLVQITYSSPDEVVDAMKRLLLHHKARAEFVERCERTYRAGSQGLTALAIYDTILETADGSSGTIDDTCREGQLAGAVLSHFLFP